MAYAQKYDVFQSIGRLGGNSLDLFGGLNGKAQIFMALFFLLIAQLGMIRYG